uniref:RNase H type-1 domain-containing protein n=1 Tax=Cannabis sativa TaxID=3483 RepID=A0A803Q1P7_CANSA
MNKVFHGGNREDGSYIASYAKTYYGNCILSHNCVKAPTAMVAPTTTKQYPMPTEGVPWRPPNLNGININVDATVNQATKTLDIGALIQDHNEVILAAIFQTSLRLFSIRQDGSKYSFS